MRKDIEAGDYLLALDTVPKPRRVEGQAQEEAEGHAVKVRVTRLDKRPLHGATLAAESDEMAGAHGPFQTVAEALAHGEAWGRHYVARVLGHGV
ncbi:hypothetical protein [Caballeronia sp. Lep1P3]|uniref:hypothetical protein n=1 Tax=Caballeronia sp. Lep1P3 TaxID=2878150 RepID=UPI001FD0C553|nr:hypothetical protein [Caballeronia sp. Lep1P3]